MGLEGIFQCVSFRPCLEVQRFLRPATRSPTRSATPKIEKPTISPRLVALREDGVIGVGNSVDASIQGGDLVGCVGSREEVSNKVGVEFGSVFGPIIVLYSNLGIEDSEDKEDIMAIVEIVLGPAPLAKYSEVNIEGPEDDWVVVRPVLFVM